MLNTLKTCIFQLNMFQYFRILKASIIGQNFIIKLFNLIQIVPNIDKFLDISGDSPSLHLSGRGRVAICGLNDSSCVICEKVFLFQMCTIAQ